MGMFARFAVLGSLLLVPFYAQAWASTQADRDWQAYCRSMAKRANAKTMRQCYPKTGRCVTLLASGRIILMEVEDVKGATIARWVCLDNAHGDVRRCSNWDTTASFTDMKDKDGVWRTVPTPGEESEAE